MRKPVGGTASVWQVCEQPSPSVVLPSSQVSPCSTTPLPQTRAQSLSVSLFAPGGQQPSPSWVLVIGSWLQVALHVPAERTESVVQASASLQSSAVGHAPGWPAGMRVSQVSGGVTTPSPHVPGQSLSLPASAPAGQQPSPFWGWVISVRCLLHLITLSYSSKLAMRGMWSEQ